MSVTIEREMYGTKEHLMLRVGKSGVRITRELLAEISDAITEFEMEHSGRRRDCPECGCQDQWERNGCILAMRCCNCDHEEAEDESFDYYDEDHQKC